jgi:ATP-binding cassette subfamily F protein uup
MLAAQAAAAKQPVPAPAPVAAAAAPAAPVAKARKLSYKDKRELDELPARIAALEAEQKTLGEKLASTELYANEPAQVPALQARYAQIDDELLAALERWEALS